MSQEANITIMIKAARAAAKSLLHDFLEVENLQVTRKGATDFVSKADTNAEAIIRTILADARPNYGFVGEESIARIGKDPTRNWIVDPLDGTTNYLHGLPHWCISIALEQKGEIVAGVIFDPVKSEIFRAEKGGGAWLNDNRIRVSERDDFTQMIFATGQPKDAKGSHAQRIKEISRLVSGVSGVREWGVAALNLAYVAAGRFDGYWEDGLAAWDLAAGEIIAREAGAIVHSYDGETPPYRSGSVITSNHETITKFTKTIRGD